MEIELRHMRAFVALAEERHFGRAAERLHIAQPPLSRQIRDLEEELGTALVDRSRRPVRLTLAGEGFLEQARLTLEQARRTVERGRRAGRGEPSWLRVAAMPWAFNDILPAVVRAFRTRLPDVGVSLSTLYPPAQADSLRHDQLDVALAQWLIDTRGLEVEPLLEQQLVALVPARHRFSGRETLSLTELTSESFVGMCSLCSPNVAQEQAALFQSRGLRPNFAQKACGVLELLSLVACGFGLGLSYGSMSVLSRPGLAYVPVAPDAATYTFFLLWRRDDEREHIRAFLDTAREVARSFEPSPSHEVDLSAAEP